MKKPSNAFPSSRADFSEDPAFSWMSTLSTEAKMAIRRSKIIFCNGYGFDELPPLLLASALDYAVEVGTSVFFDPGPRGKSLITGTANERKALEKYLRMSDVLLLTSEEVNLTYLIGLALSYLILELVTCLRLCKRTRFCCTSVLFLQSIKKSP